MINFRASFVTHHRYGRLHSLHRQLVLPLLIVAFTASCTTWRVTHEPVQVAVAAKEPSQVRVTLRSGLEIVLRDPMVEDEVLRGRVSSGPMRDQRFEVPTDDVVQVELRKVSVVDTALLVALLAGGIILIAVASDPLGSAFEPE